MPIDLNASDPVFMHPGKRPGEHVDELIAYARERLGLGPDQPWKLVGSRGKLGKTLFEVEDERGRRLIGKVSHSERARRTFDLLTGLWRAGMCPPSRFRVAEPVAWFPEQDLLLQARAEGVQLLELIRSGSPDAVAGAEGAAMWLHALQRLAVNAAPAPPVESNRYITELAATLTQHRNVIERTGADIVDALARDVEAAAPSHGDFHPMNVYIVPGGGSVTAIDLDTFALREPAADVAYFLAQTAIMVFHALDSFEATAAVRSRFARCAPSAPPERVDAHVRLAFLRSLHYDLCILKTGSEHAIEPFLRIAASGLES